MMIVVCMINSFRLFNRFFLSKRFFFLPYECLCMCYYDFAQRYMFDRINTLSESEKNNLTWLKWLPVYEDSLYTYGMWCTGDLWTLVNKCNTLASTFMVAPYVCFFNESQQWIPTVLFFINSYISLLKCRFPNINYNE